MHVWIFSVRFGKVRKWCLADRTRHMFAQPGDTRHLALQRWDKRYGFVESFDHFPGTFNAADCQRQILALRKALSQPKGS